MMEGGFQIACSRWVYPKIFRALLLLLQTENGEALSIALDYGLRIGDVLRMPTEALRKPYWSFKEEKTGKRRRVRLSETHKQICWTFAGKNFVFEHRTDPNRHRTRQAVYKDIKRLATALGYKNVTPHSARKIYAVSRFKECGDLERVQRLLNHSDASVTALYALADAMAGAHRKQDPRVS